MTEKIDACGEMVIARIDEMDKRLSQKLDTLDTKVSAGFEELRVAIEDLRVGDANDRVWWLMIAGALLGVMAHGFKWI